MEALITEPVLAPIKEPTAAPRALPDAAAPRTAPVVAPQIAPVPVAVSHEVKATATNKATAIIGNKFFFMISDEICLREILTAIQRLAFKQSRRSCPAMRPLFSILLSLYSLSKTRNRSLFIRRSKA